MLKALFTSTAIVALAATGPALADNMKNKNMPQNNASETQDNRDRMNSASRPHTAALDFVARQSPQEIHASELIGKSVYGANGSSIGDINNVVLSENGEIAAVVIGVGGFLGIGEKNVGVKFSALSFVPEAELRKLNRNADNSDKKIGTSTSRTDRPTGAVRPPVVTPPQQARDLDAKNSKPLTLADNRIMLDATKAQLESAPTYLAVGQQRDNDEQAKNKSQPAPKR